jgi:hypothetical protein
VPSNTLTSLATNPTWTVTAPFIRERLDAISVG